MKETLEALGRIKLSLELKVVYDWHSQGPELKRCGFFVESQNIHARKGESTAPNVHPERMDTGTTKCVSPSGIASVFRSVNLGKRNGTGVESSIKALFFSL